MAENHFLNDVLTEFFGDSLIRVSEGRVLLTSRNQYGLNKIHRRLRDFL